MTAEQIEPASLMGSEVTAGQERAQLLETIDVAHMQSPNGYNPDDDIARKKRVDFLQTLPKALSPAELDLLVDRVGRIYKDDDRLHSATQVQFLMAIGDSLQKSDEVTARNAEIMLMQGLGLRGKLGALSLMKQRIFSF